MNHTFIATKTFKFIADFFIDFKWTTGTGLIAALKEARNCVAVEEDSAKLFHLPASFNQLVPSAVGRKNDESSPAPGPTDVYDYESDSNQTLQSDSSN